MQGDQFPFHIALRPALPTDSEFLFSLYARLRQAEMSLWGWPETQQQAFLQIQFRAQQAQYLAYPQLRHEIVLRDHVPVGQRLLAQMNGQIRLVDIALLPAFQRQGIGTALMKRLLSEAESEQRAISLHVTIDNPARRLYERLGFFIKEDKSPYLLMEWQPDNLISPEGDASHAR